MNLDSKKFLIGAALVFICFILFLILFIFYLPEMIGTPTGTRIFTTLVNKKQENQLKIEELKLSWTQGQMAKGIQILNPQQEELFHCDAIHTHSTLWDLLVKRKPDQEIHLLSPTFFLNQEVFKEDLDLTLFNDPQPHLPFFGKIIFENASFKAKPLISD